MLHQPTIEKLRHMHLSGMAKALEEQRQNTQYDSLGFEERLGLLVDREMTERDNSRLRLRLRSAKLRLSATIEDVNYREPRNLDKNVVLTLASCRWIAEHHNCLITGPTGVGKSYLACALAHKACQEGLRVLYLRASALFDELTMAKADGRYRKLLAAYARLDLLVIDDWGLTPLNEAERQHMHEIMEDRYDRRATLLTTQVPVEKWHTIIGDPSRADAILDRLVHNAHKIDLKGDSLRKKYKKKLE